MASSAAARRRSSGRAPLSPGWRLATFATVAFFLVWSLLPVSWMLLASFKTNKEIYQQFTVLPNQWYFGHYVELIGGKFGYWMRNSAIVALTVTATSVVLGSLAAYAIARLRFAGRGLMARGLVFVYLVPGTLLFIPLFQVVAALELANTLYALMLVYPSFTLPFCTWMLVSYFRSIPYELEEAALIDGCSRLGVLLRITLPLSTPAIGVVALYSFMQSWNEFLYALVFTTSKMVSTGLTEMVGEEVLYWGPLMAGATIMALPPLLVFLLAQRLVIAGLVGGGVKG